MVALTSPEITLGRRFARACRPARLRPMGQFAEQEVVIADGPHEGRFRLDTQPFARLLFDEIDSGRWSRFVITGPSQTGKSLLAYVIPCMYHLFEMQETVICGVPTMDMASDKWNEDFLPAIKASRYRDLLPASGAGSRGGKKLEAVRFRNGTTLKFMSGGGDDKKRSAFTARVLLVTEANGLARSSGERSNEASAIKQLVARTRAFGPRARIYTECTQETTLDYIQTSLEASSNSRIALPCPHCGEWVTPEREHLVGWQDAADELAALDAAHLECPECRAPWTEPQRIAANHAGVLAHKGQSVGGAGEVAGDLPRVRTLGFRWSATNNLLNPIAEVGAEEWAARRSPNEEDADREMSQFVWATATQPRRREVLSIGVDEITHRMSESRRGVVPAWADALTLGVDCGQYLHHWVLLAGDRAQTRHLQIVDYGVEEVHSHQRNVDDAVHDAAARLGRRADEQGWPDSQGEARHPDMAWYDSGWKPVPIYRAAKALGPRHWPSKGFGLDQYSGGAYRQPKSTGATVEAIYDHFHLARIKNSTLGRVRLYEFDADDAKGKFHARLGTPIDEAGAVLLPQAPRNTEHLSLAKHFMAEQLIDDDGIQKWAKTPGHGGKNHWLDAGALALLAFFRLCAKRKSPAPRMVGMK